MEMGEPRRAAGCMFLLERLQGRSGRAARILNLKRELFISIEEFLYFQDVSLRIFEEKRPNANVFLGQRF